ncbi:hypothetical protein PIB30_070321, partial [Stylosanthes scabra]|nr:hypothetical protein [Stylosanthes scabra]
PPFPQPTTIPPPQPKPPQANSFDAALEKLTLTTAGLFKQPTTSLKKLEQISGIMNPL